jgi:hypothetical protein
LAQMPCGPDVERHVAGIHEFDAAGFTHIALVQVGAETQERFLSWAATEPLPALRTSWQRRGSTVGRRTAELGAKVATLMAPPNAGHPGRWRALAVSQIAAFMALLDVSIVNVALPSIERDLGASPATVQWVVSGYALTFGLALVPAGRLGDTLGRRRMFLIGLSAFVVTSALTGAAPSIGLLIAARLLQGVAGGTLVPQNSGLIQELFQGAERGRAFGILGATIGLATAAGPVIGG